jgi:hypothetical protein
MNTKIGTSFGLALLVAIAVVATMFAMGMLTPKPTSAAGLGGIGVAITPATAYSNGQYTITVSGTTAGTGLTAIPVGGTITVTFGTKFTVPSSIDTSNIKLKATVVSGGTSQNPGYLNDAETVTIVGRAVTITVPDMDDTAGTGDQAIAASAAGVASNITITFTQAAGILNPKLAQTLNATGTGTLTVKTSTDATAVAAATTTAITSFSKFSPTTGGVRGAEIAVTGGGFTASCDDCKIRLNPQASVAPTTGAGGTADNGSGTIDANGAFVGTITLGAGTKAGGYVWITDSIGVSQVSSTSLTQKPSAVPASTSSKPGSTVSVTLTDWPLLSNFTLDSQLTADSIVNDYVTIGGTAAVNTAMTFTGTSTATSSLTPFKFVVPTTVGIGTHKVVITIADPSAKTANFMLTVGLREITVTPATAAPGQAITISGTGFTKSDSIAIGALTMKAGSVTTTAAVNAAAISIDTLGAWNYATTMPTLNATSCSSCSATIVFTATDTTGGLVGVSDTAFSRTLRSVTLSPTTISPGGALTVTAAGFAVDTASTGATFTVSVGTTTTGGAVTLVGTYIFPLGADGTGVGTVTLPTTVGAGTLYVTATDNAATIHATTTLAPQGANTANNSKQVKITVPKGVLTIDPLSASTGELVTLTGENFPPNTTATTLTVGTATAMPAAGILTDASGGFTTTVEVPAATAGGSLAPGTHIVLAKIGEITGTTTEFNAPNPAITVTPSSASVEEVITVTGTGFNSLGTVTVLTIGSASALPSPAPRATRSGGLEVTATVPLLNPGTYTVTMTNATGFSASTTFTAVAAKVVAASTADDTATIFADVIANDDNLVRVWRFSNPDQSWSFYDPRPAFASANTLAKTGSGDIVWVNVKAEQTVTDLTSVQNGVLSAGWNLISLK